MRGKELRASIRRATPGRVKPAPGTPSRHNLSPDEYDDLHARQLGVCANCHRDVKLVIDHDHSCCPASVGGDPLGHGNSIPSAKWRMSCGQCVRGLLCYRCNNLVGYLENTDPDVLVRALRYIDGHNPRGYGGGSLIPLLLGLLEYSEEAA